MTFLRRSARWKQWISLIGPRNLPLPFYLSLSLSRPLVRHLMQSLRRARFSAFLSFQNGIDVSIVTVFRTIRTRFDWPAEVASN